MTTPSQFIKGIKEEFALEYSDEDEKQTKRCSQTALISQHSQKIFYSSESDEDLEELELLSQQLKKNSTTKTQPTEDEPEKHETVFQAESPVLLEDDSLDEYICTPVSKAKEEKVTKENTEEESQDESQLDSQTELFLEQMEKESVKKKSQEIQKNTTKPQEQTSKEQPKEPKDPFKKPEEKTMNEEEFEELEVAEKLLSLTQFVPNMTQILEYKIKEEPKKIKLLNAANNDAYQLDLEEIMLTEDQEIQEVSSPTQPTQSLAEVKQEKSPTQTISSPPLMKHTPSSSTSKLSQKKRKREQKPTKFKKLKFDESIKETIPVPQQPKQQSLAVKETQDKMEEEIIQFETPPTQKESQISEFSLTPPITQTPIPSEKERRVLLFNHFGSMIYQRAHHYFEDGRIFEMELKKIEQNEITEIKANCFGSNNEPYHPIVAFDSKFTIQKATCNCPYKNNCKHCCALLMAYFDSIEQEMPLKDNLRSKLYVSKRKIETLEREYTELDKECKRLNEIVNRQKNEGKKKLSVNLRKVLKLNLDQWPFYVQFE